MYLVMTVQHNRVTSVKAFDEWNLATMYADGLAINLGGFDKSVAWENNEYRNVFEHRGVAIMIEPCDAPHYEVNMFKNNKKEMRSI